MNRRVIKSILRKKFNDLLDSVEDENVRTMMKDNTIITGGCIASMLLGEQIHDFDMYFTNKKTVLAVAEYYVNQFNKAHDNNVAQVLDGEVYSAGGYPGFEHRNTVMLENLTEDRVMVFINSDGIAGEQTDIDNVLDETDEISAEFLEDASNKKSKYRPVFLSPNAITLSNQGQLVIRFYGDADTIHENYDFAHCTSYWESSTGELTLRPEAVEALITKELRYVASRYPICLMLRLRKFIKRGFP